MVQFGLMGKLGIIKYGPSREPARATELELPHMGRLSTEIQALNETQVALKCIVV